MKVSDLAIAACALEKGYSLVVVREGTLLAWRNGLGINPLLSLVEEEQSLEGVLGDKVVGRAAALLTLYGGFRGVYARVMSRPALELLRQHGIPAAYRHLADYIINRRGDGICPMEQRAATIHDPKLAPGLLRDRLRQLQQGK